MDGLFIETLMRPCLVQQGDGSQTKALFYGWANQAYVVGPSMMIGGSPGGQVWNVWGLVELESGEVVEVPPGNIRFLDNKFKDYDWSEGT